MESKFQGKTSKVYYPLNWNIQLITDQVSGIKPNGTVLVLQAGMESRSWRAAAVSVSTLILGQSKSSSLTMRWSVDTDPLVVIHERP